MAIILLHLILGIGAVIHRSTTAHLAPAAHFATNIPNPPAFLASFEMQI
jgi:hypothetical protein